MATIVTKDPRRPDLPKPVRFDYRALLFWYLRAVGFIATSLLMTWGLFVLFFLVVGGFSFDGLMHQLNNLTSRYVAADAVRITAFRHIIFVSHVLLAAAVLFFRRHILVPQRHNEGSHHHG